MFIKGIASLDLTLFHDSKSSQVLIAADKSAVHGYKERDLRFDYFKSVLANVCLQPAALLSSNPFKPPPLRKPSQLLYAEDSVPVNSGEYDGLMNYTLVADDYTHSMYTCRHILYNTLS